MADTGNTTIKVTCPCCDAILTIDMALATVLSHEIPARPQKVQQLKDANRILQEEATHRQEKYRNIFDAEKDKGKVLDRKFEELLKKAKEEPIEKPLKDIDLD
jgi:hypothetical protein